LSEIHVGGCLCGAVRYRLSAPVGNLCYCHCHSCRRAVGAAFVAWGTVPRERFALTRGTLTIARTSASVERGFCGECGSSLTYAHEGRAGEIDVTLATLDEPERLPPERHIWVRDKLPWVHLDDGLPQLETVSVGDGTG